MLCLQICGIVLLCLTSSIFDFIVTREMYYTVPDMVWFLFLLTFLYVLLEFFLTIMSQRVLIRTDMLPWFYGTSVLCFVLSSLSLLASNAPRVVQNVAENFPQLTSFLVSLLCLFLINDNPQRKPIKVRTNYQRTNFGGHANAQITLLTNMLRTFQGINNVQFSRIAEKNRNFIFTTT